jgi:hypothetical protein
MAPLAAYWQACVGLTLALIQATPDGPLRIVAMAAFPLILAAPVIVATILAAVVLAAHERRARPQGRAKPAR